MKDVLTRNHFDIIGLTETKRNPDHPVTEIHKDYAWIGKDRVNGIGGGIGFMYSQKSISIQDDNLLNSRQDEKERLWISVNMYLIFCQHC